MHFLPNSIHQMYFISNDTWSPVVIPFCFVCGILSYIMVSHILKNKFSHVVVPYKLLRLACSSNTSKDFIMSPVTIIEHN
jgi:hypothetical protein